MIGGTNWMLVTCWPLAFRARSTNVPTSLSGMLVLTTWPDAEAIPWNLSSSFCGLICCSMAVMTHRCRAMRS
jgi:hypothetical protein